MSDDPIAINRAHWDALAAVHGNGTDRYYDVRALLAGERSLTDVEWEAVRAAVGDPRGIDVLHVQCHIGFDSISLARAGARVTGVDLSPASLAKAADFAKRSGVDIEFVEGNAMDLPTSLHDRFDLAYATFGVIGWIGDVDAWMRSVAACMRPGGSLVLVEIHPLFGMIESLQPLRVWSSYAFDGPEINDDDGSYAEPTQPVRATRSVLYQHSLGEVVTAARHAGLHIDTLVEHLDSPFDVMGWKLTQEPDGRWRCRIDGYPMPVLFTLTAMKDPA